jgi:hypothetical protein
LATAVEKRDSTMVPAASNTARMRSMGRASFTDPRKRRIRFSLNGFKRAFS